MMKNIFYVLVLLIFVSCDPTESLEANIRNNTSQDLKVIFRSVELPDFNDTLEVKSNNKVLYSEFGGVARVGLAFHDYDSIYIQNFSDEVLKVYKEDTAGKNIYNVEEYWSVNETSKSNFVYTFEIRNEDIGL